MEPLKPHFRGVLRLALPLIASHLAQQAVGIADTLMLGRYSVEALAAGILGATVFFVIFILGTGFAMAVMPMVAAAEASGDAVQVRRVTRMGLWIAAATGVAAYPFFWFSGPILVALGQVPEVAAEAQVYLRIAGASSSLSIMVMVLKSHLAALERTGMIFWSTVAGAVLNAAMNWVLIFGNLGAPELGLTGAAIATIAANTLVFAVLALHAANARGLREYALFARIWRPDWVALGQVFRLGWPIGLTQLAETGLFAASSLMMGWISVEALAAHGVAIQIASLTFMVHVGLSSAATVRAGRAWGRSDWPGLRLGAWASLGLSGGMVAVTMVLFLGIPAFLIGLFLSPDEPARAEILSLGIGLLAVGALFQLADAAQVMALGLLRGMQDTRVPMIHAVLSYWALGLPASYVLGFIFEMGGQGVWLGLVVGLTVAGILMMSRFWRRLAIAEQQTG